MASVEQAERPAGGRGAGSLVVGRRAYQRAWFRGRELLAWVWHEQGWMAAPLAIALSARVMVYAAGTVGARLAAHGGVFHGILSSWQQRDANWYVRIASNGYTYSTTGPSSVNFFPLYPLAMHLLGIVTTHLSHSNGYLLAGMLISWVAFLAASVVLYRLVADRFGVSVAYSSVLLLGMFPFSFYYGTAYTESLYLLFVLLAFLGIERRNWWLSGAATGLASAARPTGLIVALAVATAYGLDWLRTRHALRWDVLALALTPLGLAFYAIYCQFRFGDPFAYAKASEIGWQGGHLQLGAVKQLVVILTHPGNWFHSTHQAVLYATYSLALLAFLAACYPVWHLLGAPYALYALLSCVVPVLNFDRLNSTGRYLSVIFPVFIVLAYALRERPLWRDVTLIGFTIFLGIFAMAFAGGYGLS